MKANILFQNDIFTLLQSEDENNNLTLYQLVKNKGRKNTIARVVIRDYNLLKTKYIGEYEFIRELLLIYGYVFEINNHGY